MLSKKYCKRKKAKKIDLDQDEVIIIQDDSFTESPEKNEKKKKKKKNLKKIKKQKTRKLSKQRKYSD